MKLLLMTLTCLCAARASGTGANRLIRPTEPIEAVEGDDVTLRCRLDPPVNIVNNSLAWRRVDINKEVHSYQHGQDQNAEQMDQYRNRTTLDRDNLSRGVSTLRISSVNLSDSGLYKCSFSQLRDTCTINVTVVRRDKQDETKTETTRPSPGEANKAVTPVGKKRSETVRAGVISPVVIVAFILCPLIVVLVLKRLRGTKEQKPKEASNGYEMVKLDIEAAEGDEDQEGPAEDVSGSSV